MSSKPINYPSIPLENGVPSELGQAIFLAVCAGDVKTIKQAILNNPAVLDCYLPNKQTLLMTACERGQLELVQFLLGQLDQFSINHVNEDEITALYLAAKYQHRAVGDLLMQAGARSCPVLWKAVKENNKAVVDFLLRSAVGVDRLQLASKLTRVWDHYQ